MTFINYKCRNLIHPCGGPHLQWLLPIPRWWDPLGHFLCNIRIRGLIIFPWAPPPWDSKLCLIRSPWNWFENPGPWLKYLSWSGAGPTKLSHLSSLWIIFLTLESMCNVQSAIFFLSTQINIMMHEELSYYYKEMILDLPSTFFNSKPLDQNLFP